MTGRLAFRVSYLGDTFHGSQRQIGVRTVEGDIISALEKIGAIDDVSDCRFAMASRTDRGVGALGNCFAIDCDRVPEDVLRSLNRMLDSIWITGYALVDDDFNPRHAHSRKYRHVSLDVGYDRDIFYEAASSFTGEHDMVHFCKLDDRETRLSVDRVNVEFSQGAVTFDVEAPFFLWHQVIRMVGACQHAALGSISVEDIHKALEGVSGIQTCPAHPGGLTLMEVVYGFDFVPVPTDRRVLDDLSERFSRMAAGTRILRDVAGELEKSD